MEKRILSGQMRLGDAELTSFGARQIIAKIESAKRLADLHRLILLPSANPDVNKRVLDRCRDLGIEVYLWYKVLSDNNIMPERDELNEDAWGNRGSGESGVWKNIFDADEAYLFCCPRNKKYNQLLHSRCQRAVREYDGLYADYIGFPPPTLGLEFLFSCFCPSCLEAEPKLAEWRNNARELREFADSASDRDFERWGTHDGCAAEFGLTDFFKFREKSVIELSAAYAKLARSQNKAFALDMVSPALTLLAGHNYAEQGKLADWIKPRIYWRVFGPSSIPLEFYSFAMGMVAWGRRFTISGALRYIERSSGIEMPTNIHSLAQNRLSDRNVLAEISRARALTDCPVHPAFECALHPEYDTGIDEAGIKNFLAASRDCPGVVLTWNLLYVPERFLEIIGENR